MSLSNVAKLVVIAASAFLAWQLLVWLPELPERLTTKFAIDGTPRSSSSKTVFAWIFGGIAALMVAAFAAIGFLRGLSDTYISGPNRNQWLVPERREAALEDVVGAVRMMLAGTVALLSISCWLVIEANRVTPPRLSVVFFVLLVTYLAGMCAVALWLHRRFRRLLTV